MRKLARSIPIGVTLLLGLAGGASAETDPPGRVGRLSLIEGQVTLRIVASGESMPATLNWPIIGGAAISTEPGARAEVRIGSTAIRLDGATDLEFVEVDDETIGLRLDHGAVAVRVRDRESAKGLGLETPEARVAIGNAGRYRFDVDNDTTAVIAFQGSLQVDAAGTVVALHSGKRAEVGPAGGVRVGEAVVDQFDDWTLARDRRDDAGQSARYVSPETTGVESLDEYGDWRSTPEYGPVWYPRGVAAGWVPYRSGRWAWIEPWGWTWIDYAPWGFAPFHYGRWAFIGGVWGWVPGAVVARPVYAPALVGWLGNPSLSVTIGIGAVPAVGWFPLAPREVFVPAYRASTAYVRNVNVTHVTNLSRITNVTQVQPRDYAYGRLDRAVTVVPATTLAHGQPVAPATVRARPADLAAASAVSSAPPDTVRPVRHWPGARDDARFPRRTAEIAPSAPGNARGFSPAPLSTATGPDASGPRERDWRRDLPERRVESGGADRRVPTAQAAPAAVIPPAPRAPERSVEARASTAQPVPAVPIPAVRAPERPAEGRAATTQPLPATVIPAQREPAQQAFERAARGESAPNRGHREADAGFRREAPRAEPTRHPAPASAAREPTPAGRTMGAPPVAAPAASPPRVVSAPPPIAPSAPPRVANAAPPAALPSGGPPSGPRAEQRSGQGREARGGDRGVGDRGGGDRR